MASVRFICGTQDVHKELDKAIQVFHKLGDKYELTQCRYQNTGIYTPNGETLNCDGSD
jgi:glycine C-acetyltransferase